MSTTPGPWTAVENTESLTWDIVRGSGFNYPESDVITALEIDKAEDAFLIAAAPAMKDEIERYQQQLADKREANARLRDALAHYGVHRIECARFKRAPEDAPCDCGFSEVLREMDEGLSGSTSRGGQALLL